MTKEDPKDQRHHKRYNIQSGAFALLKCDDLEILGSIKDISSGGLCLSHIDEHKEVNSSKLTVNLISEESCYENFPSRAVWNKKEDGGFMAAMVKMRRRGLKFEQLDPDKELELKLFIDALSDK